MSWPSETRIVNVRARLRRMVAEFHDRVRGLVGELPDDAADTVITETLETVASRLRASLRRLPASLTPPPQSTDLTAPWRSFETRWAEAKGIGRLARLRRPRRSRFH